MFGHLMAKFDQELFDRSFKFFYTILELDKYDMPIEVTTVHRMKKGHGGHCGPVWSKDSTWYNLKIEKIDITVIKTVTVTGMIEALAHEMIHAKQLIKGELEFKIEKRYKFFGLFPYLKSVKYWKGKEITDLSYYERPCEREAFLFQRRMITMFLKQVEEATKPEKMSELLIK